MCFSVFIIVLYRKHSSFFIDFKDSVISCQLKTNNTLTSITGSEKVVDVSHTHTAINVFLSLLFPAAKHWLRISTSFHPPAPPLSPSLLLPSLSPSLPHPSLTPSDSSERWTWSSCFSLKPRQASLTVLLGASGATRQWPRLTMTVQLPHWFEWVGLYQDLSGWTRVLTSVPADSFSLWPLSYIHISASKLFFGLELS